MSEREKIIAFLRREANNEFLFKNEQVILQIFADRIEDREHLKRTEPTIPASRWVKESNLSQEVKRGD